MCEYCVHTECHDFGVPDCKECATYVPDQELVSLTGDQVYLSFFLGFLSDVYAFTPSQKEVVQTHHMREGNLPANSKCLACRKSCWSAECLAGLRCEWCGTTVS